MFHPARKVRDVYWKIYNSLYIGSQVKLVNSLTMLPNIVIILCELRTEYFRIAVLV